MMRESLDTDLERRTISELMLGPHLVVEARALIPVVEVYASILPEMSAGWMAASPKAVVVVDKDSATALPMTDEPVSLRRLLEDLPELASRIEQARRKLAT